MLTPHSELRRVSGLSDEEGRAVRAFLQGAVYCWCKNRPREWFSLRDLTGGDNALWRGTPLYVLREKHRLRTADALKAASIDCGWLLKQTLQEDRRVFETTELNLVRKYRWTGDHGMVE